MGFEVVAISSSSAKEADAREFGAHREQSVLGHRLTCLSVFCCRLRRHLQAGCCCGAQEIGRSSSDYCYRLRGQGDQLARWCGRIILSLLKYAHRWSEASGRASCCRRRSPLSDGGYLHRVFADGKRQVTPLQLIVGRRTLTGCYSGSPKDNEDTMKFCHLTVCCRYPSLTCPAAESQICGGRIPSGQG